MSPGLLQLPEELQARVLHFCNMHGLFNLCLCNKKLYRKAHPTLWESIDFLSLKIRRRDDEAELQRRFLAKCDSLRRDEPQRWAVLAALPKVLKLSRLPGPKVFHQNSKDLKSWDKFGAWVNFNSSDIGVYDIIAEFVNLEALTIFVKENWGGEPSCEPVENSLAKLQELEIGGQVSAEMLRALLSRPDQIKSLSLINLVNAAGQDCGPDGVIFLKPIQDQFRVLNRLHLSKLAPVHDDFQEVVMLHWEYDFDQDADVLRQWAGLLENVSSTLEDLTLENCYHIGEHAPGRQLVNIRHIRDPGSTDGPDDPRTSTYGITASNRCKDILSPVIQSNTWPRLKRLVLKGMSTLSISEDVIPADRIQYLPGSIAFFNYDATPLCLSPPESLFGGS